MHIKSIKLKNFRNYNELNIGFNKKVNIIIGDNAQGKTNLIESLYINSIGRSFRTNKLNDLISFNKDYLKTQCEIEKKDFDISIDTYIDKSLNKKIKIDGKDIKKVSELMNKVHIVIFSPEDLKIIKDEPERRRKFIDKEICQLDLLYYDSLLNYKKVLLQRNAYLKENKPDMNVMDIFNIQLSKYGSIIIKKREEFIRKLSIISDEIHCKITQGKENIKICYRPNIKNSAKNSLEEYFYDELNKNLENDIFRKSTGRGPHKDDIDFYINGVNVRNFGSQGQQRTSALSLKLSEIKLIEKETGETPILILDDVMSELDKNRQEFLIKTLSDVQIFITTTEITDELSLKFKEKNIYKVKNGKIIL